MEHIHRNQKIITDELSKIAAKRLPVAQGVFVEYMLAPSIKPKAAKAVPPAGAPREPQVRRREPTVEKLAEGTLPSKQHFDVPRGKHPALGGGHPSVPS
jgi:hypothetical protein